MFSYLKAARVVVVAVLYAIQSPLWRIFCSSGAVQLHHLGLQLVTVFLVLLCCLCVSVTLLLRAENRTRTKVASWCPSWWTWSPSMARGSMQTRDWDVKQQYYTVFTGGNCSHFLWRLLSAFKHHSCARLVIYYHDLEVWAVSCFCFQSIVRCSFWLCLFFLYSSF